MYVERPAARLLCDPALDREQVRGFSRAAMRADSVADVKIAQKLVDSFETDIETLSLLHAVRLMDVLNEVSTGARLLPQCYACSVIPIHTCGSKAALLVGRASAADGGPATGQSDADPRIAPTRLKDCGRREFRARELLQSAASDTQQPGGGQRDPGTVQAGRDFAIADF